MVVFKNPFFEFFFIFFATLVEIFFCDTVFVNPFLYFFCVPKQGLNFFLSSFVTLVGKFFLWSFDRHENQVPCCTLLTINIFITIKFPH